MWTISCSLTNQIADILYVDDNKKNFISVFFRTEFDYLIPLKGCAPLITLFPLELKGASSRSMNAEKLKGEKKCHEWMKNGKLTVK